jgi:hypothetical protein
MTKNLAIALATCLLLLSTSVLPADAELLYSLTGVVGDANWMPADPGIAGPGSFELYRDLRSVFQYFGGPGGLITIDFSGPPVAAYRSQESYSFFVITATCTNLSGCYTCTDVDGCNTPDFSYVVGQGGNVQPCCDMYPIDSSFHVQELDTPPFAPYGAVFTGYMEGYVDFFFDAIVTADTAGQPFSLTVNTVADNSVPEPPDWTLMLAGLLATGFVLRGAPQKRPL